MTRAISPFFWSDWSFERRAAALIALVLALRGLLAASTGLGVDESYTVATSRDFALSAFDHPPLSWWMAHFAGAWLGESSFALRLPFIALSGLTAALMFALTARLFSAQAAFYAVLCLCLSPALGVVDATFILPDAPLLPAMLGCALCLANILFQPNASRAKNWLGAGFCAGLALISKYHGIFLFAGVGMFLLLSPQKRFWLLTPWPWLAGLVAALIFSPVLIWNAQHDWVSFLFQSGRSGPPRFNPLGLLTLIGLQALLIGPWFYFPAAGLFFRALLRGPSAERDFFLACLGAFPILLLTVVALWSSHRVLPHWAAPGYLMMLPLLGREIAARIAQPVLRRALAAVCVLTFSAYLGVLALARLPLFGGPHAPLLEMTDWDAFAHEFFARDLASGQKFVAATRWLDGGKLDYALRGRAPVIALTEDPRGFAVTRDINAFVGRDAVIVAPNLSLDEARARFGGYFATIEPLDPITIAAGGAPAIVLDLYLAKNFHDPAPAFSLHKPVLANGPAHP